MPDLQKFLTHTFTLYLLNALTSFFHYISQNNGTCEPYIIKVLRLFFTFCQVPGVFLLLSLSSVAQFWVFYVISQDLPNASLGRPLSECVFSVCLSGVRQRLSLGCLQQLCKHSWKLQVDRAVISHFPFPYVFWNDALRTTSHRFHWSLHNGTFHIHV